VRAFAILMMLQGHFIDTLLDPVYKETSNQVYMIWKYFRGITAPTFFTISGFIFTYLLIRAKKNGTTMLRLRKGITRGLTLIAIGYLLRIPILSWLIGTFNTRWLTVDVLQCIGISLIGIVVLYSLALRKTLVFSILLLFIGLTIFITEPLYRNLSLRDMPLLLRNYFTKANGSIFTITPWVGYVALGGFMSTIFYRYFERKRFKPILISAFISIGLLLIFYSSYILNTLSYSLNIPLLKEAAYYNYLFTRFGNVLILFAIFYLLETYLKNSLILKIGQKTLSIYVIHFIIIYGSFTGLGCYQLIGKTLLPWQAILGALLFMIGVCIISFHYVKTNTFIYDLIRKAIRKLKTQ
jgi:uncharacterized membrane protein